MSMEDARYLEAKWSAWTQPSAEEAKADRQRVVELIAPQWAEKMNVNYGIVGHVGAYKAKDMYDDDDLLEDVDGDKNRAPLTTDLVQFVMYLREHTDFFSGPDLDIKFPEATDPAFYEVLAQNALLYTEE